MFSELAQNFGTTLSVAYGLLGLGVFLLASTLLKESQAREAAESLNDRGDAQASNKFVRFARPFFGQYFVPMIRGKPSWDQARKKYRRKIISAGLRRELTPDEFIAFKAFNVVFFPIMFGMLNVLEVAELPAIAVLSTGALGWFYPDLWVKLRIEERQRKIRRAMPFIVDLLALSTEAGLDFLGGIQKVVEKAAQSPLVDEFEQMMKEIKVGASRTEALREMAERIGMSEMNSFVAILISADQMGAPIGKTLKQQSEKIRNDRFVMAEKAGAQAGPKLILATVLLILPAVILIVIAPMAIMFMTQGAG